MPLSHPLFNLTFEEWLLASILYAGLFIAYFLGQKIYRTSHKRAIAHPLVIATAIYMVLLIALGVEETAFRQFTSPLFFFLTLSVVCLAPPCYKQWPIIKQKFIFTLTFLTFACPIALLSTLLCAYLVSMPDEQTLALLTKSITTPIAVSVTQQLGGDITLAALGVIITGLIGVTFIPTLVQKIAPHDPVILGLTLGVFAHAVGTARAFQHSQTAGAFSTIAMVVMGLFYAITLKFFVTVLKIV